MKASDKAEVMFATLEGGYGSRASNMARAIYWMAKAEALVALSESTLEQSQDMLRRALSASREVPK